MKKFLSVVFLVTAMVFGAGYGSAAPSVQKTVMQSDSVAHGGGCRKNSPPGQCCHMDHKTGIVHCH